jgi:outer membrane PBP1 activator LpoA protein
VREGAEVVVGPLLKEEIAELAGAELLPVPALVLNWADEGVPVPAHMVQFALAPEDEAAAAARRVIIDDWTRGVALVPDTDQGRRMAQSFALELQRLGGVLLDWQMYDPAAKDFSTEIGRLLLLDESRSRHQKLQSILGRRLEFEPHRRGDAEFLFLAARAPEGRLIRPQLRYHFAGDLPVYATSLIYEPGHPANPDLDGIVFDDMPWRTGSDGDAVSFMEHFDTFGRDAVDRMGRLYAFGVDAWRLLPLVHNRSGRLASGIDGLTGTLSLDEAGRVRRDLSWARIRQGRPQPLPTARDETAGAGPAE